MIHERKTVENQVEAQRKRAAVRFFSFHFKWAAAVLFLSDRLWWPDRATPKAPTVVVTEMDSTYLKAQRRARAAGVPVGHFPMHFGLQDSGCERRYARRDSTSVKLKNKRWIMSARSLSLFGRWLSWQR